LAAVRDSLMKGVDVDTWTVVCDCVAFQPFLTCGYSLYT
jgi:hypothetical protein